MKYENVENSNYYSAADVVISGMSTERDENEFMA